MDEITSYKTLADISRVKLNRGGSRFIGTGRFCPSEEDLLGAREEIEGEFSDSTHVCSGSIIVQDGRAIERYENDGEPSGTAGEPILGVLKGKELRNCAIFVVRYFGGTKLGTGGLVRAYSDAARGVIEESEIVTRKPRVSLTLLFDYPQTGRVMNILAKFDQAEVVKRDYGQKVNLEVLIAVEDRDQFVNSLIESSSNKVEVEGRSNYA